MATEIEASNTLVLGCGRCGERVVLLGREDDWLREGRPAFSCSGCGRELTLGARVVVATPCYPSASPSPSG